MRGLVLKRLPRWVQTCGIRDYLYSWIRSKQGFRFAFLLFVAVADPSLTVAPINSGRIGTRMRVVKVLTVW